LVLLSRELSIFITINYNASAALISDTPSSKLVTALGSPDLGSTWARGCSHLAIGDSHTGVSIKFCIFKENLEKANIVPNLESQYFLVSMN
jgi:hypothetical protein